MSNNNQFIIIPGHNEQEPGSCSDNYCENELAKEWAKQIFDNLALESFDPLLISSDEYPELQDKVQIVNEINPIGAVELHFNSNIDAKGSESLYYPGSEKGKELASYVQEQFEKNDVFQPNRGVKEGYYWSEGEKGGILYLLRKTTCPTVIIESEFISNEEVIINNKDIGCQSISQAISLFCEGE